MKIAVLTFLCLACSTSGFQKSPSSRVNFYLSQKSNAASFPSESEVTRSQELTPADFIRLSKEYLADPSEDRLAEDFVFRGPLIGPIVKKDYFSTIKSVAVDQDTAFPDMQLNAFGFTCDDPIEPTRVWYFIRRRATFKGSFKTGVGITMQPTGKKFIGPPEARSFVFNEQGKIKHYSIGYVTDRFTGDTTGGMGAIFGMVSYPTNRAMLMLISKLIIDHFIK